MYNAYYDHDLIVNIADDTQFRYDGKEFLLRTNCDLRVDGNVDVEPSNLVYIDSNLDNPTTFMASTVSTVGKDMDGNLSVLFPVGCVRMYALWSLLNEKFRDSGLTRGSTITLDNGGEYNLVRQSELRYEGDGWVSYTANQDVFDGDGREAITAVAFMKPLDIYNKDVYSTWTVMGSSPDATFVIGDMDLTSLSMDAGMVQDSVLGNEHVFAFANLINIGRKTGTSYAKAEKMVARDVANLVEKIDVATVATSANK
jgi:hypothetical protein